MRQPEKTRQHILEVAFWEIYKNGFHNVSINDILSKTTLTKGAFFHYFPTKNDLGYAIADEILSEMTLDRWIRPLAAYKNPIQGVLSRLKTVIDESEEDGLGLGCPLNNLVQEMSAVDPVFREKLMAVLELWISGVEKHMIRSQEHGYLKPSADPREVATFIVMAHEGAFGMSKAFRSKKLFYSLYHSLREYLQSVTK